MVRKRAGESSISLMRGSSDARRVVSPVTARALPSGSYGCQGGVRPDGPHPRRRHDRSVDRPMPSDRRNVMTTHGVLVGYDGSPDAAGAIELGARLLPGRDVRIAHLWAVPLA